MKKFEVMLDKIYKYRFAIAVAILIILILLNLNGSSIGFWNIHFEKDPNEGVLIGHSRKIRHDEYVVNTMMAFSQYKNDFGFISNRLRGSEITNMFILYGQPVKDIAILFRVFLVRLFILKPRKRSIIFLVDKNDCFVFSNTRVCNAYYK